MGGAAARGSAFAAALAMLLAFAVPPASVVAQPRIDVGARTIVLREMVATAYSESARTDVSFYKLR